MDEGHDTAFVIEAFNRLRRQHFSNPEYEPGNGQAEFLDHTLNALVIRYLEFSGRLDEVEVLLRSSGNPHGKQTKGELMKLWREGDEIDQFLAAVLTQEHRYTEQKDVFQRVAALMREGNTLGQAAYQLEKQKFWGSRQTIKKAYKRESEKNR